ncbi:MAG: T9SS type A sorting domain-containing protein [Bacteroidetes bacterium]|nr:T9SS type A sorting domain-containing protein [Bacteroidota bacterium]MCL2303162.1 T9SS type A sorting domain-containing protein [Lentimicrobiaceae bacterium]
MKKLFTLLLCLFFVVSSVNAQQKGGFYPGTIHYLGEGMITTVSPNGNYAAGFIFGFGSLLWTKEGGVITLSGEGSQANCVSDNGVVAGRFYDCSLPYRFWDPWEEMEMPLLSGGYYKDGEWHSLGIDPDVPEEDVHEDSGSNAEGISADGTIIGGSMDQGNWALKPVVWTNGEPATWEFEENASQGAKIRALSADGTVACGWASDNDYIWAPVIWINGVMRHITHDGAWNAGDAFKVSPNGKYVSLDYMGEAAIYDVELDELTIIETGTVFGASATAVSDDGIVVGYFALGFMERQAFIYTKHVGVMKLGEYLALIGIPDTEGLELETPMGISADGLRIGGFGWEVGAWVIEIDEHIVGIKTLPNEAHFNVFPNPASDNIYIQGEKFVKAALYDMRGQLVLHSTNPNINISTLPAGNYILKIESEDGCVVTQKIVKR